MVAGVIYWSTSMTTVIATVRSEQGSSASRRLRRAGRVPAVVYGVGTQAASIELDHNSIYHALRKEEFHSSILDLDVAGSVEKVLLRAVQWHPYKQQVLHVDFQRVNEKQAIHVKVPLHFINADVSPAVKQGSAIVNHVMNELDITVLPADLPQFIEVDLTNLELGQSIHISELVLPKGVTVTNHGNEEDPAVVTALAPLVTPEDAAADAADAAGEEEAK
jgi:large subunit ribosomal protein L25